MAIKRIGILTGGGDVPGLNAVIKSATYRRSENDVEIFGLRRGWDALTHLNIEDASSRFAMFTGNGLRRASLHQAGPYPPAIPGRRRRRLKHK
jgi:6-phosphofructokinase